MKFLLISLFYFLASFTFAQFSVSYVEFYSWKSQSNTEYTTMIVFDDVIADGESQVLVRVKYTNEGVTKIVEYGATAIYEELDDSINMIIIGHQTASFVKGSGSYLPDNFFLSFDLDGFYIDGFQTDHEEFEQGEYENKSDMSYFLLKDSNHLLELIKEFYTSSDPLYNELITYASQFD